MKGYVLLYMIQLGLYKFLALLIHVGKSSTADKKDISS